LLLYFIIIINVAIDTSTDKAIVMNKISSQVRDSLIAFRDEDDNIRDLLRHDEREGDELNSKPNDIPLGLRLSSSPSRHLQTPRHGKEAREPDS